MNKDVKRCTLKMMRGGKFEKRKGVREIEKIESGQVADQRSILFCQAIAY